MRLKRGSGNPCSDNHTHTSVPKVNGSDLGIAVGRAKTGRAMCACKRCVHHFVRSIGGGNTRPVLVSLAPHGT